MYVRSEYDSAFRKIDNSAAFTSSVSPLTISPGGKRDARGL